jgi:NAD(P)-dependent dehydrogenase (short-subunit alcohol dehydrogenase family)
MDNVVITGGSSGIGAACVNRLRGEGFRVINIDLHDADVEADLGSLDGRTRAVAAAIDQCEGQLSGLVTCAGVAGLPGRLGSLLASINYFGTVTLLEGLRPLLAESGGAAVAISSNATTVQPGVPLQVMDACLNNDEELARALADEAGSIPTYAATKLAIAHWVRRHAVATEWAGAGIRLNAVAPGMVETPLLHEGQADPQVAPMLALLPLPVGRAGTPSEIAALVALLLGPDGGFFCGSVLFCDGGSDALLRGAEWPKAWDLDMKGAGNIFGVEN